MDSERFQGAAEGRSKTGIYNRDDAGKMVDLTLKLGLPNEHKNDDHLANFNFSGPYTPLQGSSNNHGMIGAGGQVGVFHYGLANGGNAVLDSPSRKVNGDGDESGNSSRRKEVPRRQRYGSSVDPSKRHCVMLVE
ncbi:hypothetical protein GH714_026956 [Hevea brasiliensis]|uniref:Uncharacterized protein n=1 Tax=Hevea brasiliensis TaxID=3981 RepID=A0A6A6ML64_HEVBR|nr:hypothetical protein GH714_026956 [Hevea brasiliensis]